MDELNDNDFPENEITARDQKESKTGSGKRRGVYYHKNMPQYYGSPAPYYGKAPYGAAPYGGGYGGGGYGGGNYYGMYSGGGGIGDDEDSLVGTITIGRMLRVCSQSWVTILVFIVIGFVASTIVYKMLPVIYESTSTIEMSVRPSRIMKTSAAYVEDTGSTGSLEEIFNTRLARLRSKEIFESIIRRYRTDNPSSTIENQELIGVLVASQMTLQRRSRLISVSAKSTKAQLVTDLVNAYALAAETFSYDQNKADSESAVAWLKTQAEAATRALMEQDASLLKYRNENGVDVLEAKREMNRAAIASVNSDILGLQSQLTKDTELLKTLEIIQNNPDRFSTLPDSIPRATEIASSFEALQKTDTDLKTMLTRLTVNHPDVKLKEKEKEIYREQFIEVLARAKETAAANLALRKSQLLPLDTRQKELMDELTKNEQAIITSKMKIEQLERARSVEAAQHQALLQRISEAQLAIDENTTTIRLVEKANLPDKPVSPNPMVVFPTGPILGLILGIVFVLSLDHLEDKIVGIPDVEQRLRLKVLAVLPHVRRKKRDQMALLARDDKFSQFVEGVSGLRNLLDSPRYADIAHVVLCMSTQPGEGKTITSTNLATVCASSGQKTLLIDFDLRRPRLAGVFEKSSKEYASLPHTLVKKDSSLFEKLPTDVGIPNLDVVFSKASSEISPAALMGTGIISEFFDWARKNYDRVVIDSPPFGIVSDVMTLANLSDSVLMMCCPDRTRFRPIKFAVRSLTEAGARIIGVVVNDVDFGRGGSFSSEHDYQYKYSYRYASRYGAYGYSRKAIEQQEAAEASADNDTVPHISKTMSRSDAIEASILADDDE